MSKKKKRKIAAALKYDKDDIAPKVIAKGLGLTAEKIVDKGKEEGVEIWENHELADELITLEVGQEIPEELYTVVAEIMTFVYQLDKEKSEEYVY
ncbi:EscU/YscU/HrcU family type III secretion system export apparatus switch protein [Dethiothermospora halolimnae]|uniref:EscU/YscU/HrcU family type III secretion system export apparatus switch protein n=1 Tax=Dethiothermospora halolimnae TaxID=3114390 RepID=UPI003CCB9801